ncbi:MAG: hypothetical protein WBM35_01265 [Candidatus Electrothrix sp.]
MTKNNILLLLTIMLASSGIWVTSSFADFGPQPDVEGLSLEEAEERYGAQSGNDHRWIFEVNAESGNPKCVSIGPDCSKACPTPKIFYQFNAARDTGLIKVDVYHDNNDVTVVSTQSCDV